VKAVIRDAAETAGLPLELIASRRYLEPAVREGLKTGSIPFFLKRAGVPSFWVNGRKKWKAS